MEAGKAILDRIIEYIVNPAILLVFSLGFLLFIWGLVVFISNPDDAGKRQKGIQHMIWGVVGMFIMVAVQGIIALIVGTFDLQVPARPFSSQPDGSGGAGNYQPANIFPTL